MKSWMKSYLFTKKKKNLAVKLITLEKNKRSSETSKKSKSRCEAKS